MADKRRRHLGAARGAPSRSNDLRVAVWLQPAFTLRSQIRGRRSGWKSVFRVFRVFRGQSFLPLVAVNCTATGQLVRKLRGFRGQTQETDRIMAAQNHAEQEQNSCWQDHKRRGRMILSSHDSVFFHLVAAWPLCVFAPLR